jgi:hypothetical protein
VAFVVWLGVVLEAMSLMKNLYAIQWKSTANGSRGTGTRFFAKQDAERLAAELNANYPEIEHEAVIPAPPAAEPAEVNPPNLLAFEQ